jgi:hypothetical protein
VGRVAGRAAEGVGRVAGRAVEGVGRVAGRAAEGVGRVAGRAAGRGGTPCGLGGRKGWGALRTARLEGAGHLAGQAAGRGGAPCGPGGRRGRGALRAGRPLQIASKTTAATPKADDQNEGITPQFAEVSLAVQLMDPQLAAIAREDAEQALREDAANATSEAEAKTKASLDTKLASTATSTTPQAEDQISQAQHMCSHDFRLGRCLKVHIYHLLGCAATSKYFVAPAKTIR